MLDWVCNQEGVCSGRGSLPFNMYFILFQTTHNLWEIFLGRKPYLASAHTSSYSEI